MSDRLSENYLRCLAAGSPIPRELNKVVAAELLTLRAQNAELVAALLQVRAYAPPELQSRINAALRCAAPPASGESRPSKADVMLARLAAELRVGDDEMVRAVEAMRAKCEAIAQDTIPEVSMHDYEDGFAAAGQQIAAAIAALKAEP